MIHKFKLFDTNVVFDVNSGAVYDFDDLAYEALDYYKDYTSNEIVDKLASKYNKNDIIEALDEIRYLEYDGRLFSKDEFNYKLLENSKTILKALCLHVSHDCNLKCKYCFASEGSFGMQKSIMSLELAKKAVDFLIEKSEGRKYLEIDFFGGEPLLNFEVVKEVIEYARSKEDKYNKKFRFTITTNALTLSKDDIEYINKNMYNLVLSLDGRKEVNDKMRVFENGVGSYDYVISKVKQAIKDREDKEWYVRGTFTRQNLDFSNDILHLVDQGFKNIALEPVIAEKGTGFDIREQDLPIIFKEYEKLAYEFVGRKKQGKEFNFFHFKIDLDKGPCLTKRVKGCGAGFEYAAITPEGDIYPCHQFVGIDEFKIGNIQENKFDIKKTDQFKSTNVYTREQCKRCFARFYCGGGCAANAYKFNTSINEPYSIGCEMQKKRVECALWIKTQIDKT